MSASATEGVGENFDRGADVYDEVVAFNLAGARHLIAALPDGEYRDLLDVGCGTGFASFAFADRFGPQRMTGVDASSQMLAVLREKLVHRPDITATLHAADVAAMPVPAESFDAVISSMAFHWFPRKQRAVQAMADALKPGGVLAILTSGAGGEGEFRRILARLEPGVPTWVGAFETVQRDIPDMERYFAAAGLEPVDIWAERRIRRMTPAAYLERMRVVAGHIAPDGGDDRRQELEREVSEAVAAACDAEGRFAYTFVKLFALARKPLTR